MVIEDMQQSLELLENRQYTPRVLQDLKCAKKKKGE